MNLIEALFRPLSLEVAASYFNEGTAHFIKGDSKKVEQIVPGFSDPDLFEKLLAKAEESGGEIGIYAHSAARQGARVGYNGLRAKAAYGAYASSFESAALTIYNLEHFDEHARQLVTSFRSQMNVAGTAYASVWRSVGDYQVGLHSDSVDVAQLQLQGTKKWHLSKHGDPHGFGGIRDMGSGGMYLVETESGELEQRQVDLDSFIEVVSEPGDVIIVPQGAWHGTQQLSEEPSLALTLAYKQESFGTIVDRWITGRFESDKHWMHPPLAADGGATGSGGHWANYLAGRLAELKQALEDPAHLQQFREVWAAAVASTPTEVKLATIDEHPVPEITPQLLLTRNSSQPVALVEQKDHSLALYFNDSQRVVFEQSDSHVLARRIVSNTRFSGSDALGWAREDKPDSTWRDVVTVLAALVDHGVLTT